MNFKKIALGILATVALAAACAPTASRPETSAKSSAGPLVWPQPPHQERIRFIRAVARPADLGIEIPFWKRMWETIVGAEETWLVRPTGVAADGDLIYVADPGAQSLWILDLRSGRFQRITHADSQLLISPVALALGSKNRIYLADSYLAKVFIYDAEGKATGTISDPKLKRPAGLAYDAGRDRLYVADSVAHQVWIFTGDGRPLGAIGRRGTGQGEFNVPTHLVLDREGTLFVTDSLGFRIQFFSPDGTFVGQFGRHGDTSGDFAMPKGVALDSKGHIYVVDALFDAVQIFDRQGRFLLGFGERGTGLGQFWLPGGLFIGPRDRIYVADAYNQRIQIFDYVGG